MAYQERMLAGVLVHHKVYQSDVSAGVGSLSGDSLVRDVGMIGRR
jgi:hypothetical protein